MGRIKGLISWILLIVLVIVGLFVGRSIWTSLQDTRAKLKEQEKKMTELARRDSSMRAYVDSLDVVISELREREARLAEERDQLQDRLARLQIQYDRAMARIDTLWEASSVVEELDRAFPHWKGQFREAMRADGIHGLIAPRFFGAEVVEIKTKLDKSQKELYLKDSTITNLNNTLAVKDSIEQALSLKSDSLQSSYNNLWGEYQVLDTKYRDVLKRKWFTLHLGMDNIVSAGIGLAAGYGIGKL